MATTHVDPFVAGLDAFQAVRRDLLKRAAGAVWVRGSMAAEDLRSAGGCTGVARVPALHHLLASDRETQRKERDMPLKEYKPGQAFNGRIGRTIAESEPAWPEPQRAKQSAPSVLFIVLDDTGYGQLGCYGGLSETPNLDRLAGNGLLYTNNLTPAEQTSAAGPYDRWPLGRGFERYYGFLGGDTHQYYPDLVADNRRSFRPGRRTRAIT
jgi:hypothetical protein